MDAVGLIAEYNPFHNGHLYHLNKAKELAGTNYTVCVMSGNFLQRGEPALINKWARTWTALKAGIDLVIELPVVYATSSAQVFAEGAVSILTQTGIVGSLCFGSELGDLELLQTISQQLIAEPPALKAFIQEELARGVVFPVARMKGLLKLHQTAPLNGLENIPADRIAEILIHPNNILAIAYLQALANLDSPLRPLTVRRRKAHFHQAIINDSNFASATAIRNKIHEICSLGSPCQVAHSLVSELQTVVPEFTLKTVIDELESGAGIIELEDFAQVVLTMLRKAKVEEIRNVFDVAEGLEYKIKRASMHATSLNDLLNQAKSKRYTWTRLQRIILHYLLGFTSQDAAFFAAHGGPQYIRILGFSEQGRQLLKKMKKTANLPIISKLSDFSRVMRQPSPCARMLELDLLATDLYFLAAKKAPLRCGGQDYTRSVIYYKA